MRATYELESDDVCVVEAVYGPGCLTGEPPTVTLSKGYQNETTYSGLEVELDAALRYLVKASELPQTLKDEAAELTSAEEMVELLNAAEQTSAVQKVLPILEELTNQRACLRSVLRDPRRPHSAVPLFR